MRRWVKDTSENGVEFPLTLAVGGEVVGPIIHFEIKPRSHFQENLTIR
jgi:hypothetical protein